MLVLGVVVPEAVGLYVEGVTEEDVAMVLCMGESSVLAWWMPFSNGMV